MKKHLVWILFTLCFGISSSAQTVNITDSLDYDKIGSDSVFISKLAAIYNNHPVDILSLFDNCNRKADDLGFGYYSVDGSYGPDNTSNLIISYQFIFDEKKLIAYQLSARLPLHQHLVNIYKRLYSILFKFNEKAGIGEASNLIYHKYTEMTRPLKRYNGSKIKTDNKQIQFLMTPFSGIMYGGEITGYLWAELPNRVRYEAIKSEITPEIDYMMLYSLNPATRFCAVEYYYQHPELFKDKAAYEARISAIYKDMPIITTIIGTNNTNQNAEELVRIYASKH